MRNPASHPLLRGLSALTLALAAVASPPQKVPAAQVQAPLVRTPLPLHDATFNYQVPDLTSRDELLPPNRTVGQYHLKGVVRDRTVILRWANSKGEMPTEGVVVSRQKVGETSWKELNARAPVAFFRSPGFEKRLGNMTQDKQEKLKSLFYSDVARDPATSRHIVLPDLAPKGVPATYADVKFAKIPDQFRSLRAAGKLGVSELMTLNAHADLDPDMADALGLIYKDRPGSGSWRYKITVRTLEGASLEAVCPATFDPAVPTPIPPPTGLTARSANGAVLLDWKAPAGGDTVESYNIYRASDPKGPFTKVNGDPVKLVELTAEDPELTLRRSLARGRILTREMKKVAPELLTPVKVAQLRALATDLAGPDATLPALSAAQSSTIKTAVAAGKLHPGGAVKALSVYSDSIKDPANTGFSNERTYYYALTSLDFAGGESVLDTSAPVAGTPKDLQPPRTPGQPGRAEYQEAKKGLQAAQASRLKDPVYMQANLALAAKAPGAVAAPQGSGVVMAGQTANLAKAPVALKPEYAALSLGQAKRLKLGRMAATMPVKAMAALGEASVLYSLPDGSAPKVNLVWTPSPDADLKEYTVYRSTNKGPMARIAVTAAPAWQDAGLEVGKAFSYAVSATDQLGNESARSPEWGLQVRDGALKTKLALHGVQGKVGTGAAPAAPGKRFGRPADRMMAAPGLSSLAGLKNTARMPAPVSASLGVAYAAPRKATLRKAPDATLVRGLSATVQPQVAVLDKNLQVVAADPASLKLVAHDKVFRALPMRSFNPMLVLAPKAAELSVTLTWAKPLDGYPLEYSVFEAPQGAQMVSTARRPVTMVNARLGLSASAPALKAAPVQLVQAKPIPAFGPAPQQGTTQVMSHQTASPLGFQANKVKVGSMVTIHGAAVQAVEKRELRVDLQPAEGPGTFTLISSPRVKGETFVATFPAEAAQYGGASFFFQVQAHTREFGLEVDGPLSEVLEVRLPDIVPPPIPEPGSADLHEGAGGAIDVGLQWTQAACKDFAGAVVERQPMAYKMVDGLPQATTALGPPQRLTPSPIAGLAYKDAAAPGGFWRYTLRSVDQTGNESATRGSLDLLVPGEPYPETPKGVVLAGDHLSWQPAKNAGGYSVWRSFTGADGDFDCISPILGAAATSYDLPPLKKVFLKVVSRSPSGMYQAPSDAVTHP